MKKLSRICIVCISCIVLSGFIGICTNLVNAVISPEFYRQTFIGVPDEYKAMFRYAWVGGSIWGITFGGILVMIIGTVLFRNAHKHSKDKRYDAR